LTPPRPGLQICPAQAITIETEEREDGSRRTTRYDIVSQELRGSLLLLVLADGVAFGKGRDGDILEHFGREFPASLSMFLLGFQG
jgi:hypothetical protein